MSNRESRSFQATTSPDPYWPSGSRFMRREHILARETWISSLQVKEKANVVLELETTLKGLICSINLRNHPGYHSRIRVLKENFRSLLMILHQGAQHALKLTNRLLDVHNNVWIFQHYFDESSFTETKNIKLFALASSQETPEASLLRLKKSLLSFLEISNSLLASQHISFRIFYRVMSVVEHELIQNHFFKPPNAFEFRSEYDFMLGEATQKILTAIRADESQKRNLPIVLFLLRSLNYTHQIEHHLASSKESVAYLMTCALISDIRASLKKIGHSSAQYFGETFEKELFAITASSIHSRYTSLMYEGSQLLQLRVAFNAFVATLQLALHKTSVSNHESIMFLQHESFQKQITTISKNLQIALQNCLSVWLTSNNEMKNLFLVPKEDEQFLYESHRKECWIFAQLVRAFSAKLYAVCNTQKADDWNVKEVFKFVRDFRRYFYSIGFILLQIYNYEHLKKLTAAIEDLNISLPFDPTRIVVLLPEWEHLYMFLLDLFESLSNVPVLSEAPFNVQQAIKALNTTFEAETAFLSIE